MLSKSTSVSKRLIGDFWVTVENSSLADTLESTYDNCDHSCLMDGLEFAQILGESSKKGFDVVFLKNSLKSSGNAFKLAVTILHKKLIGTGVLANRIVKSTPDGKLSNLYSYCSKKPNGALSLLGINYANTRVKFNVRLSTAMLDPNVSITQYLLSAQNGQVLLNNEKFSNVSTSTMKFKKLSKFSIPLTLPPFSLAFWTLKNVKVDGCLNEKRTNVDIPIDSISSSDALLRSLIANEMRNNDVTKNSRSKRQADFLPSSPFEFSLPEMPKFKFPSNFMMTSASNSRPIVESLFNKNAEIYKTNEENPFIHSENPNLPNVRDVFMEVDNGKLGLEPSLDPVFIDESRKSSSSNIRRKSKLTTTTTESPDYFVEDYADVIRKKISKSSKSSQKISKKSENRDNDKREIGELFEFDKEPTAGGLRNDDHVRSKSENIELKTVIKELEPTYRQSKKALKQAKKKWNRTQIIELLKNAQVQEIERDDIKNPDNYDIIDLAEMENPNYEEYDEDDDGFFNDGKSKRSKRHVEGLRLRNKIPKIESNEIFDSDEEESIENWMSDSHIILQPSGVSNEILSDVKIIKPCAKNSTVVRAVNFFTRSLTKALRALDKSFVGCWEIFKPKETI